MRLMLLQSTGKLYLTQALLCRMPLQHKIYLLAVCCRVATAGKLWGPALLLARHCGDKAFVETAAAMAESSTVAGTPLNSVTLLMSGRADAVHAMPFQTPATGESLAVTLCMLSSCKMVCSDRCLVSGRACCAQYA